MKTSRKPPKKALKKDRYRCHGGGLTEMFLPGAVLPNQVHFQDGGHYERVYNPETDTTTYHWKE